MTLQFIEWLKRHLDRETFPGCVWINRQDQTFKILWPRADRTTSADRLGVMYKWWTYKFGNTRNHNQPTAIKGNFRSCLNSKVQSSEIERMPDLNRREEADDYKAFRFTNGSDNKRPKRPPHPPPSPGDIPESEPDVDTTEYEPGYEYVDNTLTSQRSDVEQGVLQWKILIEAFTKNTRIYEFTYDYMKERTIDQHSGQIKNNKIHIYVAGNELRVNSLEYNLKKRLANYDTLNIMNQYPIDPTKSKHLQEKFKDGSTLQDLFCPGFVFEVDRSLNIFITRLSAARLYYGYHGATSTWEKLQSLTPNVMYDWDEGDKKQMIFSYPKFINRTKVYENWRQKTGKPDIDMIDPTVTLPVNHPPKITEGISECPFYFKITHLPAHKIHTTVMGKFAVDVKEMPNLSNEVRRQNDKMAQEFSQMKIRDENVQRFQQQIAQQQQQQQQQLAQQHQAQQHQAQQQRKWKQESFDQPMYEQPSGGYINPTYIEGNPPPYEDTRNMGPTAPAPDPMIFQQNFSNSDSSEKPGPSFYGPVLDQLVRNQGGHAGHMAPAIVMHGTQANPADFTAPMSPGNVEDSFSEAGYSVIYSPISNADTITNSPYNSSITNSPYNMANSPYSSVYNGYSQLDDEEH